MKGSLKSGAKLKPGQRVLLIDHEYEETLRGRTVVVLAVTECGRYVQVRDCPWRPWTCAEWVNVARIEPIADA